VGTDNNYSPSYAISPIDGRNRHKVEPLTQFFSELALDKYRVLIGIRYLEWMSEMGCIRKLTSKEKSVLEKIWWNFSEEDLKKIKEFEKITNHDLKAVEYWIRKKIEPTSLADIVEMVNFGLASDDVNNLAYGLCLKESLENVIYPEIKNLLTDLLKFSQNTKNFPMVARTHGQIASVTTIGKEIFVFAHRLVAEFLLLRRLQVSGKINGDVGNWHSHSLVFPGIDWITKTSKFIEKLGLSPFIISTQIEPYDSWNRIFRSLQMINAILVGLCRDFWTYCQLGIFKLKVISSEVGSSLMPHKINPIYFEGAEGGLELANSILAFFNQKLLINRLQRDFSDSTVRRNIGFTLAHCLLAYQSIREGIIRLTPDGLTAKHEIVNHYEVLAEGIQSFLRTRGINKPYELLKDFTRGKIISKEEMEKFIDKLSISKKDKDFLKKLTPESYVGLAEKIVERYINQDLENLAKKL
jgi:adenylosuccinate lyase